MVKRCAEVSRGLGGFALRNSIDRSYSRLQTSHQRLSPCLMLACGLIEVKLHTAHSSPGLSASNSLAKGYAWFLRFPAKIQIAYHASASGWLARIFFSDIPVASSISSFPRFSHSHLRSTFYKNSLSHDTLALPP